MILIRPPSPTWVPSEVSLLAHGLIRVTYSGSSYLRVWWVKSIDVFGVGLVGALLREWGSRFLDDEGC